MKMSKPKTRQSFEQPTASQCVRSFIHCRFPYLWWKMFIHLLWYTIQTFKLIKAMNNFKFINVWSGYWIQMPNVYDCIFLTLHKMTFNKTKMRTHHTLQSTHSTWQLMIIFFHRWKRCRKKKERNNGTPYKILDIVRITLDLYVNINGLYLIEYWRSHESK